MQARVVVHGLLEMFGAYFVPGQAINYKSPGQYIIPGRRRCPGSTRRSPSPGWPA